MQNRWNDADLQEAMERWSPSLGADVARRLYSARLLGQDADLVLHGGGNVSAKSKLPDILGDEIDVVYVKASGGDMSRLEPVHLPALRLAPLQRLRKLTDLSDGEMVNQVRINLMDASAPTPSIETLLHAFLPHNYIDHSHADAVLALTNQEGGDALIREALGDSVAYLPYIRPGFALAKAVAERVERSPHVQGAVLMFHGLVTFSDDARESYERHIALCTACEVYIEKKVVRKQAVIARGSDKTTTKLASTVAPYLRGILAEPTGQEDNPWQPPILEWRATPDVLDFVHSEEAAGLCRLGALTGDHVMHTKPRPLFVSNPCWEDEARIKEQLRSAVATFGADYARYLKAHGAGERAANQAPRVVLLPGAGLFATGVTKAAAMVTADIAEHTIKVKLLAQRVGAYQSLADDHLFDMEFRGLQQAKLPQYKASGLTLAGRVVVITGAAGAIGAATAKECAMAGAHVVLTDIDQQRLRPVVDSIKEQFGKTRAEGMPMDVTDEQSVREGFEHVARIYGGLDVLVPNAGVAHVAPIDELELDDFRRVMDVNALGYFLFMREGIRLLKRQATGGQIVVISSKNVFAPGKDFAAYSASKAAAHQLGKVAAIELAPFGIRVNMINPDAVFGNASLPSRLWNMVAPQRAKSRDIPVEKLANYYRQRSLLKTAVLPRHVAKAVVFFASGQTPTTGATLPVDAGIIEAFPR